MDSERWTEEELIQVYDLQKRYTEKVIDFVRNGDDGDVYKFMQLIPDLNEAYLNHEQDIFRKNEFINEYYGHEADRDEIYQCVKSMINEANMAMVSYKRVKEVLIRDHDFIRSTTAKILRKPNVDEMEQR